MNLAKLFIRCLALVPALALLGLHLVPLATADPVEIHETEVEMQELHEKDEALEIIPFDPDDFRLTANKMNGVTITHYDCCLICCGKTDGITASGVEAVPYLTCAAPPEVPLGSNVWVQYPDGQIVHYIAHDRGGAIQGAHFDICVSDHQEALELGVYEDCTVWWAPVRSKQ